MKSFEEITQYLREFAQKRDWVQFHSPKNLAMALSVEVAELLEHFQWLSENESLNLSEEKRQAVADELADVQLYLLRLADRVNVDMVKAIASKTQKNEEKYPVDLVKGSSKKYTEYWIDTFKPLYTNQNNPRSDPTDLSNNVTRSNTI